MLKHLCLVEWSGRYVLFFALWPLDWVLCTARHLNHIAELAHISTYEFGDVYGNTLNDWFIRCTLAHWWLWCRWERGWKQREACVVFFCCILFLRQCYGLCRNQWEFMFHVSGTAAVSLNEPRNAFELKRCPASLGSTCSCAMQEQSWIMVCIVEVPGALYCFGTRTPHESVQRHPRTIWHICTSMKYRKDNHIRQILEVCKGLWIRCE